MTAFALTRNVSARDNDTRATGRGFDFVRIVLAAILLTAAASKAHQLATEPVAGRDIFSCRWPLMAQVEFEIVLGVWMPCSCVNLVYPGVVMHRPGGKI